jgi:hypothetical protein
MTPTPAAAAELPPSLVSLEQKMSELKVGSMRFSLQTSVTIPRGDHELLRLLKLFGLGSRISGEVTTAPAAANLTLDLFGLKMTLRTVSGVVYAHIGKLARYDHGRPWIRLGQGGLAELFTVNGHPLPSKTKAGEPRLTEPKLAEPPFTGIAALLAGAREVRELGPATVDGQQATSFLAILEPAQLKSESLASASRLLPTPQPPTGTLEVSLTASGLPLRTVITEHDATTTTSATLEIPAVNFPLAIEAPPAEQTISLGQIRKLERRERKAGKREQRQRK